MLLTKQSSGNIANTFVSRKSSNTRPILPNISRTFTAPKMHVIYFFITEKDIIKNKPPEKKPSARKDKNTVPVLNHWQPRQKSNGPPIIPITI